MFRIFQNIFQGLELVGEPDNLLIRFIKFGQFFGYVLDYFHALAVLVMDIPVGLGKLVVQNLAELADSLHYQKIAFLGRFFISSQEQKNHYSDS